jgi:hypothetical protein
MARYIKRSLTGTPTSSNTWTISFWMKMTTQVDDYKYIFSIGTDSTSDYMGMALQHGGSMNTPYYWSDGASYGTQRTDLAQWYHVVVQNNSGTVTVYLNNVQDTGFNRSIRNITSSDHIYIGCQGTNTSTQRYFPGYITDFYYVDGTSYSPSTFAKTDATTGKWIAKSPEAVAEAINYGNQGFCYKIHDLASATNDVSGNNNDAQNSSGLSDTIFTEDSPSNNFCTLNDNYRNSTRTNKPDLWQGEGGLYCNGVADAMIDGTMGVTTGKWYYEVRTTGDTMYGWGVSGGWMGDNPGQNNYAVALHAAGHWQNAGQQTSNDSAISWSGGSNVEMSIAVDFDAGKIWAAKNGVWSGDPAAGTGGFSFSGPCIDTTQVKVPVFRITNSGSDYSHLNFGQGPWVSGSGYTDSNGIGKFKYQPPSGFLAICEDNIPDTSGIGVNPENYFKAITYTGNGGTQSITSVGFQPDLVWCKRTNGNQWHNWTDSARGAGYWMSPHDAGGNHAENHVSAFLSNGFTVNHIDSGSVNLGGSVYTAYCFKKHPDWFNIVSYTGNGSSNKTVAHGLNGTPDIVITKGLDSRNWLLNMPGVDNYVDGWLQTESSADFDSRWKRINIDSTNVTLQISGADGYDNSSGVDYVMYAFKRQPGLFNCGIYRGNGIDQDGTYTNVGFKPALVIVKNLSNSGVWCIFDTAREPKNRSAFRQYRMGANAEDNDSNAYLRGIYSSGFKMGNTASDKNSNNDYFFWMAFAEDPFDFTTAR